MKNLIASLLLILTFGICHSQSYQVLNVKKTWKEEGKRIRKNDQLLSSETIMVKPNGVITLKVETTMPMKLGPGTYHLKTEASRHVEWYNTHLQLTKLLKKEKLISCKFRYKTLAVPGSNRPYEID